LVLELLRAGGGVDGGVALLARLGLYCGELLLLGGEGGLEHEHVALDLREARPLAREQLGTPREQLVLGGARWHDDGGRSRVDGRAQHEPVREDADGGAREQGGHHEQHHWTTLHETSARATYRAASDRGPQVHPTVNPPRPDRLR